MVRLGARRGDDDLGPVTDRTGRIESCTVTASSRSVRRCFSTLDILSTPAPFGPGILVHQGMVIGPGPRSLSWFGSLRIEGGEDDEDEFEDDGGDDDDDDDDDDDGGDGHGDEPVPVAHASSSDCRPVPGKEKGLIGSFMSVMNKIAGSDKKKPEKSRPPTSPTQRKKAKNDYWEQTGPADGGPEDPVLIPSYSGHIVGEMHIEVASRFVSLAGWTPSDPAVVELARETGLSHLSGETRSEVVQTIYPEVCDIGHKSEHKLIDLHIRLDMMTADNVRWILYGPEEITDVWVSTWHGMIAYFDYVVPYMLDRVFR
ncbi:hypothetical protein M9H77_02803 [Catharanthus roseus]|uniref:Uncharacterized protein n=1 Tax=Catharanthus roseus TaxID=4058 RepID=A0ACC0C9F2_CATRO|nr:hypothetical protein M9H77_02803 [Catharanthus roseus]